jgi:hypothetical protein
MGSKGVNQVRMGPRNILQQLPNALLKHMNVHLNALLKHGCATMVLDHISATDLRCNNDLG